MHTPFTNAQAVIPRLTVCAAFVLLALATLLVVSPGTADAAKDPRLSFDGKSYSVDEGKSVHITIQLNKPHDENVVVDLDITDGTAGEADYYASGTFRTTMLAGDTEAAFLLAAKTDDVEDDSETLTATLSVPEGQSVRVSRGVATVTIREPAPGPVQNLSLSVDGTSVTADWDAAAGNVKKYIARIHPTDRPGTGKSKQRGANNTNVTFNNLKAGETYTLWVRAANKFGNKGEKVRANITIPE